MTDIKTALIKAGIAVAAIGLLFVSSVAYSNEGGKKTESLIFKAALPDPPVAALHWGRDPFVPLVSGIDSPELKLSAIFFNESNPSAIINGNVVYEKGTVAGQKVIDIGKTHVILQGSTGRIILEIAGLPEFPKAMEHPVSPAFNNRVKTGR